MFQLKQDMPALDGSENVKLTPVEIAVIWANGVATTAQVGVPDIPLLSCVGVTIIVAPVTAVVVLTV